MIGIVAIDTIRHRRLHPAFGWGGGMLLTAFTVLLFMATERWWVEGLMRLAS